jgi:RNA-directed DNA polymerase
MTAERQEGRWYQMSFWALETRVEKLDDLRHAPGGDGGTGTSGSEEPQAASALNRERALASDLMEQICERDNLNRAYKRVKGNKGAAGVDGMSVEELYRWLLEHKGELVQGLLDGSYEPQPVRGVEIPKPGGGVRQLGIPMMPSYCTSYREFGDFREIIRGFP